MKLDFLQATSAADRLSHSTWLRAVMEEGFRAEGERIEKRKEQEEKSQEDLSDYVQTVALADAASVEAFEARLAEYDYALIEALQENEKNLKAARERLDNLLEDAYVLPDGRRVFKTSDGTRVFDEHGQELSREEIDPDAIEDFRPSWEEWQTATSTYTGLNEEREKLLRFQEQVDDVRERLAQGSVSEQELAELETLLDNDMPEAVRRHLPGAAALAPESPDTGFGFAARSPAQSDTEAALNDLDKILTP